MRKTQPGVKLCFVILFFLHEPLLAQVDSSRHISVLNEVVVTGQYRRQALKQSVYQVRVISKEQIQKQAAVKLQDVLAMQLDIRFSPDLSTGGSDISMLGLSGQNVKILIDGVPMTGRTGTSNQIDINQVDINAIEKIEIVEGPMSVIYGADALGGVINIITTKPAKGTIAVTARLQEETVGREYGFSEGIHNQYISIAGTHKNWYASGAIGRNLFNGWKDSAVGRELIWHQKDQIVGNALLGYKTDRLNIYYRLDGLDEIISNPENPQPPQPGIDQDYMSDRLMQQIQATYNLSERWFGNSQISYTHFTRQVYSTLYFPDGSVKAATAPWLQSTAGFDGYNFRSAVTYRPSAVVSFQPGIDLQGETGEGERIKSERQNIRDYAFYITSEISAAENIKIRPGLRFINNSVYDAPPVIPSLNVMMGLSKSFDLRLAYANGFRAPSLRELYYDFFDASHQIQGNPNLKAETSNSFTGSLTYNKVSNSKSSLNILFSVFYNNVKNLISYAVDVTGTE